MAELMELLSSFKQEQINSIPFEGSWTAGQVTQHIILYISGFIELLAGPVRETLRKPDEQVANLKAAFLNFDIKMKSPDFIIPAIQDYKKDELLSTLDHIKRNLNKAIEAADLTKTFIGFELPVLGFLTGLEIVHFISYHTQRHIHQLKSIRSTLTNQIL